jgi:hypothetical protein
LLAPVVGFTRLRQPALIFLFLFFSVISVREQANTLYHSTVSLTAIFFVPFFFIFHQSPAFIPYSNEGLSTLSIGQLFLAKEESSLVCIFI